MHFVSFSFILFYIYILWCTSIYLLFHYLGQRNNGHEDNQEIHLKFDFKRTSCIDEMDSKKDMDDENLPLEMRRLIDHENKQILPYQEIIEVINLGSNEEKKEVKST